MAEMIFFLLAFLEMKPFSLFITIIMIIMIIIVVVLLLCIRIKLMRSPVTHACWHFCREKLPAYAFHESWFTKCNSTNTSAPLDPESQSKHFIYQGLTEKAPEF